MNIKTRVLLGLLVFLQAPSFAQNLFVDKAQELGLEYTYGTDTPSGGVSTIDFNNDGWDDLSFTSDSGMGLYFLENTGSGFKEKIISLEGTTGVSKHLLWVDYDNDGDKDLFITFYDSENRLFRNEGDLTFTDVTETAGLLFPVDGTFGTFGVAWSDYDRDGFLDVYLTFKRKDLNLTGISNHLLRNNRDGTFTDVTDIAKVGAPSKAPFCTAFVDYDNDGWDDIYISNDRKQGNLFFKNLGNGVFADISEESHANLVMDAMSVTPGDYNNNGYLDIYVTNIDGNKLLRNDGIDVFTEVANNTGVGFFSTAWAAQFFDFDNDTDLDIYMSGSDNFDPDKFSSALYVNNGTGTFTGIELDGDRATSYSNSLGDFNNDGYLDIIVPNPEPYNSNLWFNTGSGKHWLKIKLQGTASNRDAVSTQVEIFIGGNKYIRTKYCGEGFLTQNADYLHFGLGSNTQIDSLQIIWPSGHREKLYSVAADQTVTVTEGSQNQFTPKLNYSGKVKIFTGDSLVLNCGLFSSLLNYDWSTGSSQSYIVVKESGKYALSVVNPELGLDYQSDTLELVVDPLNEPQITYTKTDISCYGENDGSIDLQVNGPESYVVSWVHGSSGTSLSNLAEGVYEYEVIGQSSTCHKTGKITIWEPDSLGVILDISYLTNSIKINATVSGGRMPYNYEWENLGSNSPSVSYSDYGDFSLIVTDDRGCSKTVPFVLKDNTITSLNENENFREIKVYPNPANHQINIEWSSDQVTAVNVLDSKGTFVRSYFSAGQKRETIDISGFPQGMYFIILMNDSERLLMRRIIVY